MTWSSFSELEQRYDKNNIEHDMLTIIMINYALNVKNIGIHGIWKTA